MRIATPCALTLLGLALHGHAQTPAPVTTVAALDRVDIVATAPLPGASQPRRQVPAAVQSATDLDFDRSGAPDLASFLNRRFDSVHVNDLQGNPFQTDLNYRGYTASPLLGTPQGLSVYLDGLRMNQAFGDVVSWDLIPHAALATITLMPGSNPLYGMNTLGGALVLTTKDGRQFPGSAVQFTQASHGRRIGEFEWGGANDHGLDAYVTGQWFTERGWRDDSPSRLGQLFSKLGWQDGPSRVSLTWAHAQGLLTGNGLQEQRFLAQNWASVYTKPDQTRNLSDLFQLALAHRVSDTLNASGHLAVRRTRTRTVNGDINEDSLDQSLYTLSAADRDALTAAGIAYPATITPANTPFPSLRCIAQALQQDEPAEKCNGLITRSETRQDQGNLAGQLSSNAPWNGRANQWVLGAGVDLGRVRYSQNAQLGYLNPDRSVTGVNAFGDGVTGGNVDGEPYDTRVDLASRSRTWSLYGTDTLSLAPNLQLTTSARYNHTVVRNRDAIHPGGGLDSLDGDHRYARLNPAVGLSWSPTKRLNLYGSYSESSRAPTAIELGCANPDRPCKLPNAMAGDPPLAQVVTRTMELGLRGGNASGLAWQATLFRAENTDDILFVADNAAGYGYFRNFGKTRRQGLELGVDRRWSGLTTRLHYTWLAATYQSAETVNGASNSSNDAGAGTDGRIQIRPGNTLPMTPKHLLKGSVEWTADPDVLVNLDMIAVSGSFARGNENNAHQSDGTRYLGPGRTAGYTVWNLGAQWQPRRQWQLSARVFNLFDKRYATAAQLGATGFDANGNFASRPLGGSAATGYPLVHATFYAPGAPRTVAVSLRREFD